VQSSSAVGCVNRHGMSESSPSHIHLNLHSLHLSSHAASQRQAPAPRHVRRPAPRKGDHQPSLWRYTSPGPRRRHRFVLPARRRNVPILVPAAGWHGESPLWSDARAGRPVRSGGSSRLRWSEGVRKGTGGSLVEGEGEGSQRSSRSCARDGDAFICE
jgi:hypothetical protein